jgi:peptidyl-prolyl cis-trans isomerase SurA
VEEVIPSMDQDLDEVKGKVISDYQAYLENEWINELRLKYDIQINHRALEKIIQHFEHK